MQISDRHYFIDRQRHDLALRMIRHEARTCTIHALTGLSADRIRKLYKSYVMQSPGQAVNRHRGTTPRQVAHFCYTIRRHFEASVLASMFIVFGLPTMARDSTAALLQFGQLFCDAYETHCQLQRPSRMSFEHAWFLFHCLHQARALSLMRCRVCDGRHLHDPVRTARHGCPTCKMKSGRSLVPATAVPPTRPSGKPKRVS